MESLHIFPRNLPIPLIPSNYCLNNLFGISLVLLICRFAILIQGPPMSPQRPGAILSEICQNISQLGQSWSISVYIGGYPLLGRVPARPGAKKSQLGRISSQLGLLSNSKNDVSQLSQVPTRTSANSVKCQNHSAFRMKFYLL